MEVFLDERKKERKCPDMEVFLDTCEVLEGRVKAESICSNSSSEGDSLGILTEEQLLTAWNEDQEKFEISECFQNLCLEDFNEQNLIQNTTLNVSPIIGREKLGFPYLSALESTPKIKMNIQTSKSGIDILNKTINIDSLYDSLTDKSDFNPLENEPNKDVLNITHCVEKDKNNAIPLNRTFETLKELNKTLPSIFNVTETNLNSTNLEIERNFHNKTFSKSPKDTLNKNEITCESKKQKMPVVVKHQQMKIKNKKSESMENSPNLTTHFEQFFEHFPQKNSQQDSSQTGTRKKIYKVGEWSQRSKTNSLKHTVKKSKETNEKVSAESALKNRNQEQQIAVSQKKPFNLKFKKLDKEPKNKQELLDVPTIRLVEEPYADQIITRLPQRSSLIRRPQRRLQDQRGILSGRGGEMPNRIAPPRMPVGSQKPPVLSGRGGELPMRITPIRIPIPTRPPQVEPPFGIQSQRLPLESHQVSLGRSYSSRIPTRGPRMFGSHSIFDASNSFQDPPVRGRSSVIPKKTRKPPFLK